MYIFILLVFKKIVICVSFCICKFIIINVREDIDFCFENGYYELFFWIWLIFIYMNFIIMLKKIVCFRIVMIILIKIYRKFIGLMWFCDFWINLYIFKC